MRRILTIKEAAKLIEGLTEYRVRQDVRHLLYNLGKCTGQLPCFMAGKKYLIDEKALYKTVFGEVPEDEKSA